MGSLPIPLSSAPRWRLQILLRCGQSPWHMSLPALSLLLFPSVSSVYTFFFSHSAIVNCHATRLCMFSLHLPSLHQACYQTSPLFHPQHKCTSSIHLQWLGCLVVPRLCSALAAVADLFLTPTRNVTVPSMLSKMEFLSSPSLLLSRSMSPEPCALLRLLWGLS